MTISANLRWSGSLLQPNRFRRSSRGSTNGSLAQCPQTLRSRLHRAHRRLSLRRAGLSSSSVEHREHQIVDALLGCHRCPALWRGMPARSARVARRSRWVVGQFDGRVDRGPGDRRHALPTTNVSHNSPAPRAAARRIEVKNGAPCVVKMEPTKTQRTIVGRIDRSIKTRTVNASSSQRRRMWSERIGRARTSSVTVGPTGTTLWAWPAGAD